MGIIEIVAAVLLILASIFIVGIVLMQDSKQGMSNVISGGSSDNYYQKNSGRTKEAKLARLTKTLAIVFFVVAIGVNVIAIYFNGNSASTDGTVATTTTTAAETAAPEETTAADAEATTAAETTAADVAAEATTAETTTTVA